MKIKLVNQKFCWPVYSFEFCVSLCRNQEYSVLTFALSVCFEDVLWSWWGVMDGTGGAGPLPLSVIPGETLVVLSITSL